MALRSLSTSFSAVRSSDVGSGCLEDVLKGYLPPKSERSTWQVSQSDEGLDLSLGLRLAKLVIFLCANNLQNCQSHRAFQIFQDAVSETDAVKEFLHFVKAHNLHHLLSKLLDFRAIAIRVFAGHAMIGAVEMEDSKFLQIILMKIPPQDTKKWIFNKLLGTGGALHVAASLQNLKMVRLLLDAGFDPDGYPTKYIRLHLTPLDFLLESAKGRADLEIIQALLGAQRSAYSNHHNKLSWRKSAQTAIYCEAENALFIILRNYAYLQVSSPPLEDNLLLLQIAL